MRANNIIATRFLAVDAFTPIVNKINNKITQTTDSTNKLKNATNETRNAMQQVGFGAGMAFTALSLPLVMATKNALDFQQRMSYVGTIIDSTKENLGGITNELIAIHKELPVDRNDLAEALYQIRSAGIAATDQFSILRKAAELALIGRGSVTDAANIMTSTINVFKRNGMDFSQVAGAMFALVSGGKTKINELTANFGQVAVNAERAGVHITEMTAAIGALTNMGVVSSRAETMFSSLLLGFLKPSEEMIKMQHALTKSSTITGDQFIKQMGGLKNALMQTDKYIKQHNFGADKLFPNVKGVEGLEAILNNLDTFTSIMSKGADVGNFTMKLKEMLNLDWAKTKMASNAISDLGLSIGNVFIPVLAAALKPLMAVTNGLAWLEENANPIYTGIVYIIGGFAVLTGAVWASSFAIKTWAEMTLIAKLVSLQWTNLLYKVGYALIAVVKQIEIATAASSGLQATLIGVGIALQSVLGAVAITGALYGFFKLIDDGSEKTARLSRNMNDAKNNIVEATKPLDALHKKLALYNEEMNQYNEKFGVWQARMTRLQVHGADFWDYTRLAIGEHTPFFNNYYSAPETPKMNDYFTPTEQAQLKKESPSNAPQTNINLTLTGLPSGMGVKVSGSGIDTFQTHK